MKIPADIKRAFTARASRDESFRQAARLYFGTVRTASSQDLQAPGLQLLNTLSRVPQITDQEERALYAELVELALDRPELRSDLMPLLMQRHNEE